MGRDIKRDWFCKLSRGHRDFSVQRARKTTSEEDQHGFLVVRLITYKNLLDVHPQQLSISGARQAQFQEGCLNRGDKFGPMSLWLFCLGLVPLCLNGILGRLNPSDCPETLQQHDDTFFAVNDEVQVFNLCFLRPRRRKAFSFFSNKLESLTIRGEELFGGDVQGKKFAIKGSKQEREKQQFTND